MVFNFPPVILIRVLKFSYREQKLLGLPKVGFDHKIGREDNDNFHLHLREGKVPLPYTWGIIHCLQRQSDSLQSFSEITAFNP